MGSSIRAARRRAKLSQESLGSAANVSKAAISHYEKGLAMPSITVAAKIATAVGLSITELMAGSSHGGSGSQGLLAGLSLDERISVLPEAMREFVLIALRKAEAAARRVPEKFLRPPTSENWGEFSNYLDSLSIKNHDPD